MCTLLDASTIVRIPGLSHTVDEKRLQALCHHFAKHGPIVAVSFEQRDAGNDLRPGRHTVRWSWMIIRWPRISKLSD